MNQLTEFLVNSILEEEKNEIIGIFGGGFKPPIKGHVAIVEKALQEFPEMDKLIVSVGSGVRDEIDQEESLLVWDIYQRHLPMKVEIGASKSGMPIKDIYKLAKENPDKTIYWFIGAREGREDDLQDIAARTKSADKYGNLQVKVVTTSDPNVSGTNARKALLADDKEKFFTFLPNFITDKEKEEIYTILRPAVKEQLNEHSMGNSIDILPKLAELTQHMIDKGYNIEPLPGLELIDDDVTNAEDFFGKTAYYDPNTQTIVLYTHGRHPKDIARSFAHEMIHHIQNLEGRLGNITTTNTQEDDYLNDIEAEANLKGTMTFRNWTDSLEEGFDKKLGKDPFGLEQFARELMTEGAYDSLVTKLTKATITKWVEDSKKKPIPKKSYVDIDIDEVDGKGREIEFNYVGMVEFSKKVEGYEVDGTSNSGEEEDKFPFIATLFKVNPKVLPQAWSKISADVSDVIRHEIEHLTQSGENVRSDKYKDDDIQIRDMINKLKILPQKNYYLLDKEVDAMLQGLYLKAKKTKKPFADVINNYLDIAPGIETKEDKEMILNLWRSRRGALSLPVFENEEVMTNYTIYSDMDGVLSDFDKRFMEFSDGIRPNEYETRFGSDKFWELIDDKVGVPFWAGMDWMPDGKTYWEYIEKYNPIILSAPSRNNESRYGKRIWKKRNMPSTKMILAYAKDKKNYANSTSILIDDREDNIKQWQEAGGIGILHTSAANTIAQLKKLGL
jgi:hypothetical protein